MRHTRKCRLLISNFARARCRLILALKRIKKACTARWTRCTNCCHEFVDLSLYNFSAFLCRQHEEDAKEYLRIVSGYRKQICQLNRQARHHMLKHVSLNRTKIGNNNLIECPEDTFPLSRSLLSVLNRSPHYNASRIFSTVAPTNFNQRRMKVAHNFGPPTSVCSFCGALNWLEEKVIKGSTTAIPKFSICCRKGKVQLLVYQHAPDYLLSLLDYNGGTAAKKFRQNIRSYNSVFAFTSIGGHVDNAINNGQGPYVFKINGQNHHRIGSLLPTSGKPKFAQMYFYDTVNEVHNRVTARSGSSANNLDEVVVQNLVIMFNQCNELAKVFRMARDRFHNTEFKPITVTILERRYRDGSQYNMPTCSEIAALSDTSNVDSCGNRDIVIEESNGVLKRISEKHPSFMALQYPILFPYGEDGFRCNIGYSNGRLHNY